VQNNNNVHIKKTTTTWLYQIQQLSLIQLAYLIFPATFQWINTFSCKLNQGQKQLTVVFFRFQPDKVLRQLQIHNSLRPQSTSENNGGKSKPWGRSLHFYWPLLNSLVKYNMTKTSFSIWPYASGNECR